MLLSVVIFSMAFLLLYKSIENLKISNAPYLRVIEKSNKDLEIFETIFNDLQNSVTQVTTSSHKRYDTISFTTENSLYGMGNPLVTYVVTKKDNSLLRIESKVPIDIKEMEKQFFYSDVMAKDCKYFRVTETEGYIYAMFGTDENKPTILKLFIGTR